MFPLILLEQILLEQIASEMPCPQTIFPRSSSMWRNPCSESETQAHRLHPIKLHQPGATLPASLNTHLHDMFNRRSHHGAGILHRSDRLVVAATQ